MEAATKVRVHGLVHALFGLVVFVAGGLAGFTEIHSGPGPYPMLMFYWLLLPIGGHFLAEGLRDAMGKQFKEDLGRHWWYIRY